MLTTLAEQQVPLTATLSAVVVAILSSGFAASALRAWMGRRRSQAEGVSAWIDAADGVVDLLRQEIQRLQADLFTTRQELAQTRDELRLTRSQAVEASRRVAHLERQLAAMEDDGR